MYHFNKKIKVDYNKIYICMYVAMYINYIFIVYDKGYDWVVHLKYVENVIPLSKLIGLLFLFCLPLLSILFLKTKRNDLARPVMGIIFLVIEVSIIQGFN